MIDPLEEKIVPKFFCPRCNRMRPVTSKVIVKIRGKKHTRCTICRPKRVN